MTVFDSERKVCFWAVHWYLNDSCYLNQPQCAWVIEGILFPPVQVPFTTFCTDTGAAWISLHYHSPAMRLLQFTSAEGQAQILPNTTLKWKILMHCFLTYCFFSMLTSSDTKWLKQSGMLIRNVFDFSSTADVYLHFWSKKEEPGLLISSNQVTFTALSSCICSPGLCYGWGGW